MGKPLIGFKFGQIDISLLIWEKTTFVIYHFDYFHFVQIVKNFVNFSLLQKWMGLHFEQRSLKSYELKMRNSKFVT